MLRSLIDMTHCLIVDGRKESRTRVEDLLTPFGFDIEQAESNEEALSICSSAMPDMIFLSDQAGPRDTFRFLKRLKATARRRGDSPVVLMCADSADEEFIGSAIWNGAADCLMQPFDQAVLEDKLKRFGFA
ncbi:MAG: response regulator [Hyphomicrobiales bacterium]